MSKENEPRNRRLLLEFEYTLREINRAVINPEIKSLELADLRPIVEMVARARAAYVGELFALAAQTEGKAAPEDVSRLRERRAVFDELVAASGALEAMIDRGYVDVKGKLSP